MTKLKKSTAISASLAWLRIPTALTVAGLTLGLQACIDGHQEPPPPEVNPNPDLCDYLPLAPVSWKGGNTWGEEVTVSLDPETMAYSITIDASLQRTAGTEFNGALVPRDQDCTYDSDEAGAVFTLAPGGLLLGGVEAPNSNGFAPLLAFRSTYNNAATPDAFNDIAFIGNVIGVQFDGAALRSFKGASRLRNAGTLQVCSDGFALYNNSCDVAVRERGYIRFNAARTAFDRFSTPPGETTPVTGGDLSGSVVVGLVGNDVLALELVRASASSYGMRLHSLQPQNSGNAVALTGGHFNVLDSDGGEGTVTVSASSIVRGASNGTVTSDTPTFSVHQASGGIDGHFVVEGGVYAFTPAAGSAPALELGVISPPVGAP